MPSKLAVYHKTALFRAPNLLFLFYTYLQEDILHNYPWCLLCYLSYGNESIMLGNCII